MLADHARGEDQRGDRGDVRGRLRGALEPLEPEVRDTVREGLLVDVAGGLVRVAVRDVPRVVGQLRVVPAAGRHDVEAAPVVRVLGEAAVRGAGANCDHVAVARRIRDVVLAVVARGADHDHAQLKGADSNEA